jgi:uncharacterized OB-fold protein
METFSCFKCEKCGKQTFLKHAVCIACRGRSFKQVDVKGTGRVVTYTKLFATPEGIEDMPLVLGIMEFGDAVRTTGQIVNQDVKIGDNVHPVWGKIRRVQGKDLFGFRFERTK